MCARILRAAALVLALRPARSAPDLERLAFHFGTDKSHDDHKYTDLYAMLFAPLRTHARNITEIGIAAGQSLWLWNDYFAQAHIWGIDIAPNQLREQRPAFKANAPRVHLLLGDVTNPSEVESFGFSPESMDVIIDDGPHSSGPNERILVNMWPYLKPGGYYCVEDVQTGIDDMAATQSTASGKGVPGKPGWAYLAHGAAEGRMGERARQILQASTARVQPCDANCIALTSYLSPSLLLTRPPAQPHRTTIPSLWTLLSVTALTRSSSRAWGSGGRRTSSIIIRTSS